MDILWKIYGKYMDKYNMEKYEKIWNIYLAKYGQYMENMWTYIYIQKYLENPKNSIKIMVQLGKNM